MKLPSFLSGRRDSAKNSADAAGTVYVARDTDFVAKRYHEAKKGFEGFGAGRQAVHKAPEEGPVLERPELHIVALVEANRDQLEAHAHSVLMSAHAELDLAPQELDEAAIKAETQNQLQSELYAAQQQAQSLIKENNNAHGNLTEFEVREQQNRLSQGAYDRWGTLTKQLLLLLLVLGPDTLLNALTYASAMPQGLMQALATAFCASASMALFGILFGTGLRYFNYRSDRGRRRLWRSITIASAFSALMVAVGLAQYRALLDAVASQGDDTASSIFTVSPGIVGLPVFIGCIIVFGFAVLKFRGGHGTPWAQYADHAAFDRAFREAQDELEALKEDFVFHTEEIYADCVNALSEANDTEREALKNAKAQFAKAKRTIADLKNSHLKFVRAAAPDIGLVRAGMLADRPDLNPDDFPAVTLRGLESFPDGAELDEAIANAEAAFAHRTAQRAKLKTAVGELVAKAREDFARFLAKSVRRDETRRNPIQAVKFEIKGGKL